MNKCSILISRFSLAFSAVILIFSCTPDRFEPEPLASFSVINAAPGSPVFDVIVDGQVTSPSRLAYGNTTISRSGSSSIYLPVMTGDRNIKLSPDTGKLNYVDVSYPFERGKIYSIFVVDTFTGGKLKAIRLTDDLTLPSGSNVHVRFLNLAPKSSAEDITFVRGTLYDDTTVVANPGRRTFVPTDSVTISNKAYAGSATDLNALSAFTAIPGSTASAISKAKDFASVPAANRNNRYQIKVKTAGTQNVISSITTDTQTLTSGKIYTIITRGTAQGMPLATTVITNY